MIRRAVLIALAGGGLVWAFDLAAVKAEPNLEKRSELALLNAEKALDQARDAYQKGSDAGLESALGEVGESMELCKTSLDASGRNPRKQPKYFKKAEIGIRKLIRRLDSFRVEMSVDERGPVDKLLAQAHRLQEEILQAIMGKKK